METKTCRFINYYSEIKGLQECRSIVYSAKPIPEGVYISVSQESESGMLTENCVCTSDTFEYVTDILKFISENRIELGCWYGVLDDMNIKYTIHIERAS